MDVLIGYMIDGRNSGIDKYLLRVLEVLKQNDIHASILTTKDNDYLRQCLKRFDAHVLVVPSLMHPLKQYRIMKRILREHHFDVAYFNISEPMHSIGALAAHRLGVPRVVIHSHNSAQGEAGRLKSAMKAVLNKLTRPMLSQIADGYYACSVSAGKWLFPPAVLKSEKFRVIYNPVDVEEFAFQPKIRTQMRKELGLEDACVIGHVGNFTAAKNTGFLLDILEKVRESVTNAVLLVVGDGAERQQVMELAKKRGLTEQVRFLGIRDDVPKLLQAMDYFVLPSLFEGLPVSAIEAQMAGLKVFLSDRITDEVKLSNDCQFCSINDHGKSWAEKIAESWPYERRDFRKLREQIEKFDLEKQKDVILTVFN